MARMITKWDCQTTGQSALVNQDVQLVVFLQYERFSHKFLLLPTVSYAQGFLGSSGLPACHPSHPGQVWLIFWGKPGQHMTSYDYADKTKTYSVKSQHSLGWRPSLVGWSSLGASSSKRCFKGVRATQPLSRPETVQRLVSLSGEYSTTPWVALVGRVIRTQRRCFQYQSCPPMNKTAY